MAVSQNLFVSAQSVKSANAITTAAKTTYNDSTNAVSLLTAGANGAVLYGLTALPRATLGSAAQLQLYRSRDAGTTLYLCRLVTLAAYTMATTTSPTAADFLFTEETPLRLAANEVLYVGSAVALAGGIAFDAQYEDL